MKKLSLVLGLCLLFTLGLSAETATISNVLNVIEEDAVRLKILQQANDALKDDGKLYITVFEGNKSGVGEPTTKGYQLNKPLSEYLEEVKKVFA